MKHGAFCASFYYTDFTGARRKKMKRGFRLKRDAQECERQFLLQRNADPDMKFGDFVEIYRSDQCERIREHTWESKDNMINTKILPYHVRSRARVTCASRGCKTTPKKRLYKTAAASTGCSRL